MHVVCSPHCLSTYKLPPPFIQHKHAAALVNQLEPAASCKQFAACLRLCSITNSMFRCALLHKCYYLTFTYVLFSQVVMACHSQVSFFRSHNCLAFKCYLRRSCRQKLLDSLLGASTSTLVVTARHSHVSYFQSHHCPHADVTCSAAAAKSCWTPCWGPALCSCSCPRWR